MANLFRGSTHASIYAKFRPNPPKELIQTILSYLSQSLSANDWRSSVDVGCGSGQATRPFAKHFTHVYGFDPSSAQINEAIAANDFNNNISFNVCSAEDLPVESNSVQLVTACQAVHWFDLQKFFKEVNRILCPNGVIALFGYRMPDISHKDFPNNQMVKNLCLKFYKHESLNWSGERKMVDEGMASIELPFNDVIRKENFETITSASANEFRGYIKSWSAFNVLQESDEQKAQNFLNDFDFEIKNIFGDKDFDEIQLKIHFNYYVLMGRKPIIN